MDSALHHLMLESEYQPLKDQDLDQWQTHIEALSDRLELYETLRDNEVEIFQAIADQLLQQDPDLAVQPLKVLVMQWISVYRHIGMAVLLKDPDFLRYRLLEWLAPVVKAHSEDAESVSCETIHRLLQDQLKENLTPVQIELLDPYLKMASDHLSAPVPVLNQS